MVTCTKTQRRTGGVLGAVSSAAAMGARRNFFKDAKSWRPFLVFTLKTQVFTETTNAQNTAFPGGKCPQNMSFLKGAPVPWRNGTMASPSLQKRELLTL